MGRFRSLGTFGLPLARVVGGAVGVDAVDLYGLGSNGGSALLLPPPQNNPKILVKHKLLNADSPVRYYDLIY